MVITAIIIYMIIHANATPSLPPEQAGTSGSNLTVSPTGGQIFTNVDSSGLQQAAPPNKSTTSSGLNPQQAAPNYCSADQLPGVDACVAR